MGGYATKPRDLASESDVGTDTKTYSLTGTFRTELTDLLTLTDIANYRSFKSSLFQDLDLSAVVESLQTNGQSTTVQERRIDSKQWSNELQLNYSVDNFDMVLGGFYFHERQRPIDNVGLARRNGMASNIPILQAAGVDLAEAYDLCGYTPDGVTGGSAVIAPKRVCTHSNLGTDAWAIFGQARIGLGMVSPALDAFTLKLGGRYSEEDIDSRNPSIIIAAGGRGPVIRFTEAGTYRTRSFKDFTPEAGIEWQPNRDLLLYYTYSEGFKAGSGENAAGSTTIVDPETVQNPRGRHQGDHRQRHLGQSGGLQLPVEGRAAQQDHRGRPDRLPDDLRERGRVPRQGYRARRVRPGHSRLPRQRIAVVHRRRIPQLRDTRPARSAQRRHPGDAGIQSGDQSRSDRLRRTLRGRSD